MTEAKFDDPEAHLRTEDLVQRARGDLREGFSDLYTRIAPAVFGWASLHLRGPLRTRLDPEDLLQEVTCRAYEAFATYDADRGDFRGWVFGIARNVLQKALRQLARPDARPNGPMTSNLSNVPDTATSISQRVVRDESLREFVDSVQSWPEEDRKLLIHRGLEGLPHEEVARLLGLNVEAAAKRWQRLLDRLRTDPQSLAFLAA